MLAALIFTFTSAHANAAEAVALFLKVNGVDVKGESPVTTLGRADSIECFTYEQSGSTARDAIGPGHGAPNVQTGSGITKRVSSKSSPLLWKALRRTQVIDGTFKFYRAGPKDGAQEQFYTVTIGKARIASIKRISPNILDSRTRSALRWRRSPSCSRRSRGPIRTAASRTRTARPSSARAGPNAAVGAHDAAPLAAIGAVLIAAQAAGTQLRSARSAPARADRHKSCRW